jgi:hypothetical protein
VTLEGESTTFVRVAESGHPVRFQFCSECGSTVYWKLDALDGFVVLPVGAFADPGFAEPTVSMYSEHRHCWVQLPAAIEAAR